MEVKIKDSDNKEYFVDDKYLFIGLTSGAIKNSNGKFVNYVKQIFKDNVKQINNKLKEENPLGDDLYSPFVYNIFGDYDYAFIALADDFHFGAKGFRPYGIDEDQELELCDDLTFQYQCLFGPHIYEKKSKLDYKTIEKWYNKYNCIGITQIKLNNSLVVGGGFDFLSYAYNTIKENKPENIEIILTFNYSWNEMTLVCFSHEYGSIFEFINNIRRLNINNQSKINWYNQTLHDKLKKGTTNNTDPVTIIKETNTKFGYKYSENGNHKNIIENINAKNIEFSKLPNNGKINYVTRIYTKPERSEHLVHELSCEITDFKSIYEPRYVSGRAVITCESKENILNILQFEKIVNLNYIRKISTFIEYDLIQYDAGETHQGLQKNVFSKLEFSLSYISKIKSLCDGKHLPKMITERIIRLLVNYNQNITDPSVFTFFMELRHPFQLIENYINDQNSNNYLKNIENYLDALENAFWNRYYHTPQFIYNSDSFTEYSGGILQIISAYDMAAKKMGSFLYGSPIFREGEIGGQFVNVTTSPGIFSSDYNIDINFYHLFQPVLFTAGLMHETFNFFQKKLTEPYLETIRFISDILPTESKTVVWDKEKFKSFFNSELDKFIYFNENFQDESETSEEVGFFLAFGLNTFRVLVIDLITLKFAYKENFKLFIFWHLGHILQDINTYTINGNDDLNIDDQSSLQISARFLMAKYLWIKVKGSEITDDEIDYLSDALESCFANYFKNKTELIDLDKFCKLFIENVWSPKTNMELDQLKKIGFTELSLDSSIPPIAQMYRYILKLDEGAVGNASNLRDQFKELRFKDSFHNYRCFVENILESYGQAINDNKLLDLQVNYLSEFYSNNFNNSGFDFNQLVKTNIESTSDSNLQFYALGGIFNRTNIIRKEILKINVKYYFELWDLAQKEKLTLWTAMNSDIKT